MDILQETMEVQFTEEIQELAEELEYKPVEIYEYIRNNFKYEPYFGSLKGAQETLFEKAGNDFDLASLLISLLRTSGIKSRYVYGEIIVPIDKAMGWLGVKDPWVAGNIFATMGVPARMLVVNGKPYGLRLEHCWVEAQLNYDIDLGRKNPVSKDLTWIPMDPSYKILEYNNPVKLEEEVPLDVDSLMGEIRASANIDTITGAVTGMDTTIINQALEDYGTRTNNWIEENLGDSATIGEVFPFKWIKPKVSGGFAPVLPYDVTKKKESILKFLMNSGIR
ncbi:MAG: transglutaminase-like domain-containing protein [candidate division WOR-3 bacterium]